ncbi:MFS transporter [Sinomonas soli]
MQSSAARSARIPRPAWLTRNVAVLSGVSLLQDAASEMLYPVLPILLTVVLGAPPAVVGAVEGAAEGVASLTKVLAGRIADRVPKKELIGSGYGLAAAGKAIIAVAYAWPAVLLGRCVDRLGKGIRAAPRDALLVAGVDTATRGRAFGLHRTADTGGAVLGPALGLLLYELLGRQLRPLLAVAVIPAVLSALLVTAVKAPPVPSPSGHPVPAAGRPPALPRRLRRLIAVLALFSLVNFPDALLLLRAHDLGLPTSGVIAAYILYNIVYAGLSYPAGALSDKLPKHVVFATGLGFFALGYLGLGLISSPEWVFPVLLAYGGFSACTDGVGKAWVSSLAPEAAQGRAQGLFQGLTGGAILVAGLWAGLAWGPSGQLPLLASGAAGLGLALVLLLAGPRLTPESRGAPPPP